MFTEYVHVVKKQYVVSVISVETADYISVRLEYSKAKASVNRSNVSK